MDGTASLIYLLAAKENKIWVENIGKMIPASVLRIPSQMQLSTKVQKTTLPASFLGTNASAELQKLKVELLPMQSLSTSIMHINGDEKKYQSSQGAYIRGDSTKKEIALIFTGDEFGDGLTAIANTLAKQKINGSFFLTGRFYRNKSFQPGIKKLYAQKNLMGSHSDMHLLYNDWTKRDSILVTKDSLLNDLIKSKKSILATGVQPKDMTSFFIPPYEWWNNETAQWLREAGMTVFSFTPGTTSNADYTYPEMGKSYRSSEEIINNIKRFNETRPAGLNGVVLLIHAGTDPRRKDKLYYRLDELIEYLKKQGYQFKRVDEML